MGFADSIAAVSPTRRGSVCFVCSIVEKMVPADRLAFDEANANRNITSPMIVKALRSEGFTVNVGSVSRHRRKECQGLE